jgi:hypothetical protein
MEMLKSDGEMPWRKRGGGGARKIDNEESFVLSGVRDG